MMIERIRKTALLLLAVLCLCVPGRMPAHADEETHAGYFIRDNYIRSEMTHTGNVLVKIPAYTVVEYDPVGNTGFARSAYNGVKGYLDLGGIHVPPEDKEVTPFTVYSTENMTLRSMPFENAARSDVILSSSMMTVIGESGPYWHAVCGEWEGYVLKNRVKSTSLLKPQPIDPVEFYIPIGTELTDLPLHYANTVAVTETYVMHIIHAACGDWYYLSDGEKEGWLEKSKVTAHRMAQGKEMQTTAAVLRADLDMVTELGDRFPLPADTPVFITSDVGALWYCQALGREGYVPKEGVSLIWADTPLDGYETAASEEMTLLDFPDSRLGTPVAAVPAGERMFVAAANRNYLKVTGSFGTGYVAAKKELLCAETEQMPLTEQIPRYLLMLDKNTRMVYAFVLDEEGKKTDQVAVCARVAIGKGTTPTPSGTFLLGEKSRWHRYTNSYTPYNTLYTAARFIHGLPTEGKNDNDIIDYLSRNAGQMVTGGCLRSPTVFAKWVYLNCSSYVTELTIVKGGLELPESGTGVDMSD